MFRQLLVTFTKNYRPYSVKIRPLVKEYNSYQKKKKRLLRSFYFVPGTWVSIEFSERNKMQSLANLYLPLPCAPKEICPSKVFTPYLLSTEYYVRSFWGFGEKYDSAAKELIDHAISSFTNTFQIFRDCILSNSPQCLG